MEPIQLFSRFFPPTPHLLRVAPTLASDLLIGSHSAASQDYGKHEADNNYNYCLYDREQKLATYWAVERL